VSGRWRRLGRVVADPPGWRGAMVPFVDGDALYVSGRDDEGRTSTLRATLAPDTLDAAAWDPEPVLAPGRLGTFDDSGSTGSCLVWHEGRAHLYYIGWNRGVTVPFHTSIGLAVGDGRAFERVSEAPVLGRNPSDPIFTTSPWVLRDGGTWRMWYTSCERWEPTPAGPRHHYDIRHAESDDGVCWRPTGHRCIGFRDAGEYAIARPCVVRDGNLYRMWFSYRGDGYRIGYAESDDGLAWTRIDDARGLGPSGEGWDATMVEYPFVFERAGRRTLLYNGDGYGASGAGAAIWDER